MKTEGNINDLIGGIVHAINNPLATISGSSQQIAMLVSEESIDPKMLNKAVERIDRNILRISKILNTLLNLSPNAAENDAPKELFLNQLVDELLLVIKDHIRKNQIDLIYTTPPEKPTEKDPDSGSSQQQELIQEHCIAYCRPSQTQKVLLILIRSAIQACKKAAEADRRISIQFKREDKRIHLILAHTGQTPFGPETLEFKSACEDLKQDRGELTYSTEASENPQTFRLILPIKASG